MGLEVTANIIAARKRHGITQKEMAERLGVSQAYYSKLENRNLNLSMIQIQNIADKMGVPIEDLFSFHVPTVDRMTMSIEVQSKDYIDRIEEYTLTQQGEKLKKNRKEGLFNLLLERVFFNLLLNIQDKAFFGNSENIKRNLISNDSEYIEKLLFEEFVKFGYPSVLTPHEVLNLVKDFVRANQIEFKKGGSGKYSFYSGLYTESIETLSKS